MNKIRTAAHYERKHASRIERKDNNGGDPVTEIKDLITKQGRAFEEFKSTNDQRLKEIEQKGHASSDIEQKLAKINADLNETTRQLQELSKKANRPAGTNDGGLSPEQAEYKEALLNYMRKGDTKSLRDLEQKAMSSQSDPDGGYFVTSDMDSEIDRVASAVVVMRSLANIRVVGSRGYKKLVKTSGIAARHVGEAETGGESTPPKWAEIEIPAHGLEAEPWIPNDLLEDADYDLEGDVTDESSLAFAEAEANDFINGTGVKMSRGILAYPTVANSSYAWGKLGFIKSGANGAFAASNPADKLIDLQHALKQVYRPGATWLMNDATLGLARQMKDGSGSYYLWQPDPLGNFGGKFLGSPVAIDDYMPGLSTGSFSIAYGNFKRGYTIVDRRGIALIRDNITLKGTTKFNFTKRVGGGIINFEAIKLMQFSA